MKMKNACFSSLATLPTPMAGLALAIASLGFVWESVAPLNGYMQGVTASISATMVILLLIKFINNLDVLRQELAHPLVGSVIPTFSMACMMISAALQTVHPLLANGVWLTALAIHLLFLVSFIHHRFKEFKLNHMLPSWFVPPVGIIVAAVTTPDNANLLVLAQCALYFGLMCYAVMLPMMLYRLLFCEQLADAAKPSIAILAAPASLSLAGYLSVVNTPSHLVVSLLFVIALSMTAIVYLSFFHLLKLPFSPSYAAFTFPLVIGASALFKLSVWIKEIEQFAQYSDQIERLASVELFIATIIVCYVACRYYYFYQPHRLILKN